MNLLNDIVKQAKLETLEAISLKNRILRYLRKRGEFVNSGEIERLAMEAGYKSSNASRRCREMVTGKTSNGGTCPITLERKEEKGKSGARVVWYRALPPKEIKTYYSQGELVHQAKIW